VQGPLRRIGQITSGNAKGIGFSEHLVA
jgi:hypothetical protein